MKPDQQKSFQEIYEDTITEYFVEQFKKSYEEFWKDPVGNTLKEWDKKQEESK